jgi:hypothetical protein
LRRPERRGKGSCEDLPRRPLLCLNLSVHTVELL